MLQDVVSKLLLCGRRCAGPRADTCDHNDAASRTHNCWRGGQCGAVGAVRLIGRGGDESENML